MRGCHSTSEEETKGEDERNEKSERIESVARGDSEISRRSRIITLNQANRTEEDNSSPINNLIDILIIDEGEPKCNCFELFTWSL
jgi:hypothetical protein